MALTLLLWGLFNARFAMDPGVGVSDWFKEIYYFFHARHALVVAHRLPGPFVVPVAGWNGWEVYDCLVHQRGYWSNPEVLTFTPWLLALRVFKIATFIKIYFLAHSLAGTVGLILLARWWSLPAPVAMGMLTLTALGAWPMRHFAMGYTPHVTTLLAPWVLLALVSLRRDVVASAVASVVCVQMLFQGSLHVFLWTLGIATCVSVLVAFPGPGVDTRLARRLLGMVGFSLLLGAPKWVLVATTLGGMRREVLPGYPGLEQIAYLLVASGPNQLPVVQSAFWDAAHPIGVAGVVFLLAGLALVCVRVFRAWRGRSFEGELRITAAVTLTALIGVLAGVGGVWRALASVVPALDAERYPYRFLAVMAWLLACVAARELARVWCTHRLARLAVGALCLAVAAHAFEEYTASSITATSQPLRPMLTLLNAAYSRR